MNTATHPPDRHIDIKCAQALGYTDIQYLGEPAQWAVLVGRKDGKLYLIPFYSTDISEAWMLVEYMHSQGWLYGIGDDDEDTDDQYACFYRDGSGPISAVGKTVPAAIAAAFLAAMD